MAADNEKTVVQAKEGEPAPTGGGSKKKLILFGGIGVGIIMIGVLLAVFVLKPMMSSSSSDEKTEEPKAKETKVEKAEKPAEKKEKKEKKEESSGGGLVYAIKDIVVNPAGTGGSRFLSVSIGFDMASNEAMTTIEEKELLVRDALITILSSKTLAELTDAKQKEVMRLQIKKRVSQLVGADELLGVYYTDFVLQ